MRKLFFLYIFLFFVAGSYAQYSVKLVVKNKEDKTPLSGATVFINSLHQTAVADSAGMAVFHNITAGNYKITVSYAGMQQQEISVTVPLLNDEAVEVLLFAEEEAEEVIITATRTSRSISNTPTRVETISGEELAEKGNMKPGDIRMMLNESTGIQTQQTSATSYNSSIRIQGLDGRYTQLLRDGFPLYAGFSGGLSLMQVAPLDLKQVEVIKGSSSTLYGGGAIAGLVNLVSKTPGSKRELSFLANATSAKGADVSGFYSERYKTTGLTIFGAVNTGTAYDPAGIDLTAIPQYKRYTITPRLFIYCKKTNAVAGLSYTAENRIGGSMDYIKHGTSGYYEKNKTERFTTQLDIQHRLNENNSLQLKSSYSLFNRRITIPTSVFEGLQQSSYSELNFTSRQNNFLWIAGINFLTDDFKEKPHAVTALRNYHYNNSAVFVQNTWTPGQFFSLETGLRGDYVRQYGFVLLPRVSAMFKCSSSLTARIGGGMGYKTPTVFNEEAERMHFQQIAPINEQTAENEKSAGANLDFNYRSHIGEVAFTINQLFFYTRLNHPLVLSSATAGSYAFVNANGFIDTKGIETNLRFIYKNLKLFIGYTYADVNSYFNQVKNWFPLTARHRLNNVLMYEKDEKLKIGLEAYYFSPQKLSDGTDGKPYWICGAMAEKSWEKFSLFINFENMFDTRQTRFGSIYSGPVSNPVFSDIYAPVDGFMVNGGFKLKL